MAAALDRVPEEQSVMDTASLADQWKPLNLEEKKRYDREFLLGFQFIFASMQKPEGLPHITDVVLDKVGGWKGQWVSLSRADWRGVKVRKEQPVVLGCV